MRRGGLAGRDVTESSDASEEVLQLSSGALGVNVSTQTGRLLSLTSNAGLLSASLNAEVCHLAHNAVAPRLCQSLWWALPLGIPRHSRCKDIC